jgi:hypothetical protein
MMVRVAHAFRRHVWTTRADQGWASRLLHEPSVRPAAWLYPQGCRAGLLRLQWDHQPRELCVRFFRPMH